jgi:hypothetical protein
MDQNTSLTKHVVAAGLFIWDAGSTPAASTILRSERRRALGNNVPSYGWQALFRDTPFTASKDFSAS